MNIRKNIALSLDADVKFLCFFVKKLPHLHKVSAKGKNNDSKTRGVTRTHPVHAIFINKRSKKMWKKWKESEFCKKLKQVRVNRAVYLSAIVILLALSVVLAVTVSTNRAKKNPSVEPPTNNVGTENPDSDTDLLPKPDGSGSEPTYNDTVPELALPVSGVLSKKHSTDTQVFSPTMQDWRVHLGIDIATEENAPVCAVAAGEVVQIWEDPMMGWCLALSHTGECVTVYKNLAKDLAADITVGATVVEGQLLGCIGDSAMMEIAEEPHLHMEMTVKGLQVDPLEYFSQAVLETLTEDTIYEGK